MNTHAPELTVPEKNTTQRRQMKRIFAHLVFPTYIANHKKVEILKKLEFIPIQLLPGKFCKPFRFPKIKGKQISFANVEDGTNRVIIVVLRKGKVSGNVTIEKVIYGQNLPSQWSTTHLDVFESCLYQKNRIENQLLPLYYIEYFKNWCLVEILGTARFDDTKNKYKKMLYKSFRYLRALILFEIFTGHFVPLTFYLITPHYTITHMWVVCWDLFLFYKQVCNVKQNKTFITMVPRHLMSEYEFRYHLKIRGRGDLLRSQKKFLKTICAQCMLLYLFPLIYNIFAIVCSLFGMN